MPEKDACGSGCLGRNSIQLVYLNEHAYLSVQKLLSYDMGLQVGCTLRGRGPLTQLEIRKYQ